MTNIVSYISSISLNGNKRLGLWALLSVLTLLIFLYPAQLQNESHPIESIYVFDNLCLFGVLYFVWFAVLLVLALSKGGERTDTLEKVVLLCIFTLVFAGIWVSLRQSFAGEASRDASNIAYIGRFGHISQTVNTYRGEFPGAAILGSAIAQVAGLADFTTLTIIQLLYIVLFPVVLYFMFSYIFKDSRWVFLAVMITISGSIALDKQLIQFHPSSFGVFLLFVPLVFIMIRNIASDNTSTGMKVLMFLLIFSLPITHFVTASCFVLILAGIHIFQRFNKTMLVTVNVIIICVVVVISWEMYQTNSTMGSMLSLFPKMADDFSQGMFISGYTTGLVGAYTGESIPLWANITRYVWLALVYVLAVVLAIRNVFRGKKLDDLETWITGGLAGVGIMVIISLILTGSEEISRVLVYAPFFSVPIVMLFLYKLRNPLRNYSFSILAVVLFVFSFPTFVAHNNTVGTSAYYPYEFSGYELLKEQYKGKDGLYYSGGWHPLEYYFEPSIAFGVGTNLQYVEDKTVAGLLEERLERISALQRRSSQLDSLYLYEQERETAQFKHLLGFDPVFSPEWQEFLLRLNQQDRIFDNGFMQFYKVESR